MEFVDKSLCGRKQLGTGTDGKIVTEVKDAIRVKEVAYNVWLQNKVEPLHLQYAEA